MDGGCKVVGLYSYPVKSCRGTPMDTVELSAQGLTGDRQLMILKDNKFTNQARLPKLATVRALRIDASTIALSHGDAQPIEHKVSGDGAEIVIDFYGNRVTVVDQGDRIAQWVSVAIGDEVRVAALKATFRRSVPLDEFADIDGTDQSRFVDVAPLLVTSVASLADLNARLQIGVPMERFRPNIVVDGLDAFQEDDVAKVDPELTQQRWPRDRRQHQEKSSELDMRNHDVDEGREAHP